MIRTVLLGAGASVDAGVPAAVEMSRQIVRRLATDKPTTRAVTVAVGGLRLQKATRDGLPFAEIDVEELYECLRAIGDRHSHFLFPFVGSWSHAVSEAEQPDLRLETQLLVEQLRLLLAGFARRSSGRPDPTPSVDELHAALHNLTTACATRRSNVFSTAAKNVLRELVSLSWVTESSRVLYLQGLLQAPELRPLWIATLNYDNTVELAATSLGMTVDHGLRDDGSVNIHPRGTTGAVSLAKLHGSLDWSYVDGGRAQSQQSPAPNPVLILGSGNKLRIEGPYLDLLLAFRSRLAITDELHVCGYSFRDQHVNHLVLNWLDQHSAGVLHVHDKSLSDNDIAQNISRAMPGAMPGAMRLSDQNLRSRLVVKTISAREWAASLFSAPSESEGP